MQEETDFLTKMRGAYEARDADALRVLNSLIFEFEATLAIFPSLRAEMQRVLASAQDLDVASMVGRLRLALEQATALAVELDIMDAEMLKLPDVVSLVTTMKEKLNLSNINVYADKISSINASAKYEIGCKIISDAKNRRKERCGHNYDHVENEMIRIAIVSLECSADLGYVPAAGMLVEVFKYHPYGSNHAYCDDVKSCAWRARYENFLKK